MKEFDLKWWGKLIGSGLLLLVVGVGGYQYYISRATQEAERASAKYESMLTALRQEDLPKAKEEGETLVKKYPKTPYSSLASLLLAKIALDDGKIAEAKDQLEAAIKHSQKTAIEHFARVRLARILSSEKKFPEALAILDTKSSIDGFEPLYEEVKGDIHWAAKEYDKAREAYQSALNAMPQSAPSAKIQLKKMDLNKESE